MAARLDPAEAARRAKERAKRKFSDAGYRHYDPADGLGSRSEWRRAAGAQEEAAQGGERVRVAADADLALLGLLVMPDDAKGLHKAYRRASLTAHPDAAGGSHDAFLAVSKAYEKLLRKVKGGTR